jgi:hypothetical protein
MSGQTPAPGAVEIATMNASFATQSRKTVPSIADGVNVALGSSPSGFLLAVERSGPRIEVIPLDSTGSARAASHVITGASGPLEASRGDTSPLSGGPLLVWSQGSSRFAALLADDGSFAAPPVAVSTGNVIEPEFSSGAFTGDGFLYGERTNGVTVTKIALDGKIVAVNSPANSATEYPQLAWLGDRAGLTYADFSGAGRLMFEPLNATGAALGPAVQLGAIPTEYNRSPLISLDNGVSGVLLGGYTGGTDHTKILQVARLSATGTATDGPFVLMNDPGMATAWRTIRFGSDMIAGWIGGTNSDTLHDSGSLHLARVTP